MEEIKERTRKPEWRTTIEIIEKVDMVLFNRILRRLIYFLYKADVKEIAELIQELEPSHTATDYSNRMYSNVPNPKKGSAALREFVERVFLIADLNIADDEISRQINCWLAQERSRFLTIAAEKIYIPLVEIRDVLDRYANIPSAECNLSPDEFISIRVSLIRRFFSSNLYFINVAKHYIKVIDFHRILERIIGPARGNGKLGGKSSGLILAQSILEKEMEKNADLKNIRFARSWYITSDTIMDFIHYNALEEMITLKYMETEEIRAGYSYLQQLFKHAFFPPEIVNQLEILLDQIGEKPIIVRSSSLLEDSFEAAFSGKYKSLFLANSGTKKERLVALKDAIAEIYSSTFGPDPIEYRKERGLLDFQEEMGILIQEVVGNQIGKYFTPTFAGVAFSNNEFRWSPRIQREDGMVRLVGGLGTRAVDRVGDDYPYLASPGKPGLKVNVKNDDIVKYSQKKIDVLNLETNEFETLDCDHFLKEFGDQIPGIEKIISIYKDGDLRTPVGMFLGESNGESLITFQNLTDYSPFFKQIHLILQILQQALNAPVDVEFASDGNHLYILQCRPQIMARRVEEKQTPTHVEPKKIVFQATKYITTGYISNIGHIVYVDPFAYNHLQTLEQMKRVATVVSKLNKRLPRRSFILIGPGRWGSRGDIKLGVQVTYSDINNTSMLVELAYSKGGYIPELSFGTHFFQDLVESDIKYLPIYPDEENNLFNKELFDESPNLLEKILPEEKDMRDVVKVIAASESADGQAFSVIMDSDSEKAIGFIS